jgi:hypothetical protein
MAHPVFRRIAFATLVLTVTQSAASAQTAVPDIAGRWMFETGKFDTIEYADGCAMAGEITIQSTPSPNLYRCSFRIETVCRQQGREAEYYRVHQTCSASRVAGKVAISSRIETIEETRLNGKIARLTGYTADMFDLNLSPGGAEMKGHQFDAVRRVPARFWRDQELVS